MFFVDDSFLVAQIVEDMQSLVERFAASLQINIKKTECPYQPPN